VGSQVVLISTLQFDLALS